MTLRGTLFWNISRACFIWHLPPASHTGMPSADNKADGQMSPSLYFLCNHVSFVSSVVFHIIQVQFSLPRYVS